MAGPLHLATLTLHRLQIPMRFAFEHAAATRNVADPVIAVATAHAPFAHLNGYGETLAREYVTGETAHTVMEDLQRVFAPRLAMFSASNFAGALEAIDELPLEFEGRILHAARCAIELALLDLAGKAFGRAAADAAGWMGLPGFGAHAAGARARFSGVVLGKSRIKLKWLLRLQLAYGLRDFKIKVASTGWEERLRWAAEVLRPWIVRRQVTLRADANGGWTLQEAQSAMELLQHCGVSALEQPLSPEDDVDLPWLAEQTQCDLIADESLVTQADAGRLIEENKTRVFNIRLAKVGGLMPALRMARQVLSAGKDVQLGCLVGETGILSAAGLQFLQCCPRVRFVEGSFGTWLLQQDTTRPSVRFGVGGRVRGGQGGGLGVSVRPDALQRWCMERREVVRS